MSPILLAGRWTDSRSSSKFSATDPNRNQPLERQFPVSDWTEIDAALQAAADAFDQLKTVSRSQIAMFLDRYADAIDAAADELVATAHAESGLPTSPRLRDVELPRTSNQLRAAGQAARNATWTQPIIDTAAKIRSCLQPLGPVAVFGPNNFPFAFNSVAGGDFAAAIAAGNPVIAKANTSHPHTSELLGQLAARAVEEASLPAATVQLLYRTSHSDGERLVSDSRLAATGYTGSRSAGLKLKAAADSVGKPFYAELSSINPVIFMPGALAERFDQLVSEYVTSGLMGAGQFCTSPGLLMIPNGEVGDRFVAAIVDKYQAATAGTLLGPGVCKALTSAVDQLQSYGAELLTGGKPAAEGRIAYANTLLQVQAKAFCAAAEEFQTEMFGNAALIVRCSDTAEMIQVIRHLEGNLTGCVYSATDGQDDADYDALAPSLSQKVGRLLNDKMPTGVAVSPAMNHGGPFPATAHPNMTAVGIPTSIIRFTKLTCFDAVRPHRLPDVLQDPCPIPGLYRLIDGRWVVE